MHSLSAIQASYKSPGRKSISQFYVAKIIAAWLIVLSLSVSSVVAQGRLPKIPTPAQGDTKSQTLSGDKLKQSKQAFDEALAELAKPDEQIDSSKLVGLMVKAAKSGHADAMHHLGKMAFQGKHAAENEKTSLLWYQRSAESGNIDAIEHVAAAYRSGWGTKRNEEQAEKLYREFFTKLINKTDVDSQLRAADICLFDDFNLGLKPEKGVAILERLSAQRVVEANRMLSDVYLDKNPELTFKYAKLAADAGDVESIWLLSELLLKGNGCKQDIALAEQYMMKAYNAGFESALLSFAWMRLTGEGAAKNVPRGIELLELGTKDGCPDVTAMLAGLYEDGKFVKQDRAKAIGLWELAAKNGHYPAFGKLIKAYSRGDFQNQEKAKYWRTQRKKF